MPHKKQKEPPKPTYAVDKQIVSYINAYWNQPITKLFKTNPYLHEPACKIWLALYALTYESNKLNTERLIVEWAFIFKLKPVKDDVYHHILFLEELVDAYLQKTGIKYEIINNQISLTLPT